MKLFRLAMLGLLLPALAWVQPSEASVEYVTGGMGTAEREALQRDAGRYNLKVVTAKDTAYLAAADVEIFDHEARSVLKLKLDGPWLLAKLPPGAYSVQVSAEGRTQSKPVQVTATGQRELIFRW